MPALQLTPKLKIHYLDINPDGNNTIVLLHGLGATGQSWQLQFPPLAAAGLRIIAPDTRGFGSSSYPGGKTSIANFAQDIAELVAHLNVSSFDVVGISLGGTIALQLVLDYPQLVRKLVLVNTFACLRPDRLSTWAYFAVRFVLVHTLGLQAQAQYVAQRIFPAEEQRPYREVLINQITQADVNGYRATLRAIARFDVRHRLGEINQQTLLITASGDSTVPPRNQTQLVHGIRHSTQVVIPGAGHAVSVDSPERFNQELLKFLTHS